MKCCHRSLPYYSSCSSLSVYPYQDMDGGNRCCIEKTAVPNSKREGAQRSVSFPPPTTRCWSVCRMEGERKNRRGDRWVDLSLSSGRGGGEKERKSEFPLGTERQLLPRQRPSRRSYEVRFNSRPNDSAHHSPSHSSLGLPPLPSKKVVLLWCSVRVFVFF